MTKQEQYAWQGNFRLGYPELYHSDVSNLKEFLSNNKKIRVAVTKDFPFYKLYQLSKGDQIWNYICVWTILTEARIRQFKEYLNLDLVKKCQNHLSEDFKREFNLL